MRLCLNMLIFTHNLGNWLIINTLCLKTCWNYVVDDVTMPWLQCVSGCAENIFASWRVATGWCMDNTANYSKVLLPHVLLLV